MKRPSDDLFKLIKSLTKGEKRAFRHGAGSGKDVTKYIAIFDAIDAQKVYDEEALKRKFSNEKWVKRFNAAKDYVYNLLLDSLAFYNQKTDVSYRLVSLLMHIRVLQGKGFYDRSAKLIAKGKQYARSENDQLKMLELLDLESVNHPGGINPRGNEGVRKERERILKLLENEYAYSNLYKQSYQIFSKTGYSGFNKENHEEYLTLMKSELMSDISRALSYTAKRQFINIHYFFNLGMGNLDEMHRWILKGRDLFQSNPELIMLNPVHYATTLLNLHDSCLKQGDSTLAFSVIEELSSFYPKDKLKKHERLTYMIEYGALHIEICTYNAMGNFQESKNRLPRLEKYFFKHRQEVSETIYARHFYLVALTLFGAGDFKGSRQNLKRILEEKTVKYRYDLVKRSRVLLFMVYYELGKFDLLEYNIRSVKRFMQSKEGLNELERELFRLVSHLLNRFADEKAVYKNLKTIAEVREKGNFSPDYMELFNWVKSKLEKRTYAELAAVIT